jgi:hypothetical protein
MTFRAVHPEVAKGKDYEARRETTCRIDRKGLRAAMDSEHNIGLAWVLRKPTKPWEVLWPHVNTAKVMRQAAWVGVADAVIEDLSREHLKDLTSTFSRWDADLKIETAPEGSPWESIIRMRDHSVGIEIEIQNASTKGFDGGSLGEYGETHGFSHLFLLCPRCDLNANSDVVDLLIEFYAIDLIHSRLLAQMTGSMDGQRIPIPAFFADSKEAVVLSSLKQFKKDVLAGMRSEFRSILSRLQPPE